VVLILEQQLGKMYRASKIMSWSENNPIHLQRKEAMLDAMLAARSVF
jgi:hypothetical protein